MRTAVTLIRKHGAEEFEMITGPEVPIQTQKDGMRAVLQHGRTHPEIAEVQLWIADSGIDRTVKFISPEENERNEQRRVADQKAYDEAQAKKKSAKAAPATK